jgi:uncharacterized protein (TIGR03435 family)
MHRPSINRATIAGVALLAAAIAAPPAQGQSQPAGAAISRPTFEAISVKEATTTRIPVQWQGPRFITSGVPLQTLLVIAYDVPIYQLADLPEWVRTTRWEISALASRPPTAAEEGPWLRALLEQRFGVVARTETQERPMYALVLARPDGRLGPGLQRSSVDCIAILKARAAAPGTSVAGPACDVAFGPAAFRRDGMPLASLVDALTTRLERPVIDRTGLTGLFDVNLRFRPLGGPPTLAPDGTEEPDLITALQDQLGLKVEPIRGPMQVTIFDRVERPAPD